MGARVEDGSEGGMEVRAGMEVGGGVLREDR